MINNWKKLFDFLAGPVAYPVLKSDAFTGIEFSF